MLTIKRDSNRIKAISAGSLAFAIGLTGAAAYVSSVYQHENLVFGRAQKSQQTSLTVSDAAKNAADAKKTAETKNDTPSSAGSTAATSSGATNATNTVQTTSPSTAVIPPTPGMGGGMVQSPSPPPAPVVTPPLPDPIPSSPTGNLLEPVEQVVSPVVHTVEDVTSGLGL